MDKSVVSIYECVAALKLGIEEEFAAFDELLARFVHVNDLVALVANVVVTVLSDRLDAFLVERRGA